MKANTDLIVHDLEPRHVKVWVLGDVHVGDRNCRLKDFEAWLHKIEQDEDSYLVIIGDMANVALPGGKSEVFGDLMNPKAQMDYLTDALYNLATGGRILAIVSGNHEDRITRATGLSPLSIVAARLGIEDVYRDDFAAIRIRMDGGGAKRAWNLLAFHGASDAKTRTMAYAMDGFDALLTGHSHRPTIEMPAHLVLEQSGRLRWKEVAKVVGCSWLDYAGYGAKTMYAPTTTARPQHLVLEWENTNSRDKRLSVVW